MCTHPYILKYVYRNRPQPPFTSIVLKLSLVYCKNVNVLNVGCLVKAIDERLLFVNE